MLLFGVMLLTQVYYGRYNSEMESVQEIELGELKCFGKKTFMQKVPRSSKRANILGLRESFFPFYFILFYLFI